MRTRVVQLDVLMDLRELYFQPIPDLIPDTPESGKRFNLASLKCCRVLKAFVQMFFASWKKRAAFPGTVADRDHSIEVLVQKLCNTFGSVIRYIYAHFQHYSHSIGIDHPGFCAGAEGLVSILVQLIYQPFSHLGAGGIVGAYEQDTLFGSRFDIHSFLLWLSRVGKGANHPWVRRQIRTSRSMTGTSISTPTTVARAAPEESPKSMTDVAMATSK